VEVIAREMVAENDDWRAFGAVFFVREEASKLRNDAEHGEKVGGDAGAMEANRIAEAGEILNPVVVSGELLEGLHAGMMW
jgi:hypothetical protein